MAGRRRAYHSSEDEQEEEVHERKRRRKEITEIEDRLQNLILRVGEKSTSSLESNLEGLASVLEADIPTYKDKILRIVSKSVLLIPEKLSVYSTLVGLLNAKNYNFGGELVEVTLKKLREKLSACAFEDAIILVGFLCDLVNSHVVSAHTCLAFLNAFTEVTTEENIPQMRSDWYIFAVLSSLPWVGHELADKKPADFDSMLQNIETYIAKRQKLHVAALRVWHTSRPHLQEDYLDSLWAQISKLRADQWQERHITRPYLAFDAVICDALQHALPTFAIPPHTERCVYPLPQVVFRMFDYTDCPEDGPVLPGAHSIERFLVELEINWIVRQTYVERKDCAAALLSYPKRAKVPLNYMILEVIFGQLFHLPKPTRLDLFYGSLLIELCKLQPNSMPQVLAQAAEMLYQRLDSMAAPCFDRLVDWFSYHLSQFQFRWSWEDWTDCLEEEQLSPKQLFVREVLHKCLRLSYHQRVLDIVPSSFAGLVPTKPAPNFKYSQDGAESLPGTSIAQQLAQAIRNKCTPEEALFIIKDCPTPVGLTVDADGFNPLKVEVLVLTLLHLGSKSFSHSFAALAKYHYSLKALTEGSEAAQLTVLKSVYELWQSHPQIIVVLVDKLLKMQIIECAAVVNWIFSEEMQNDLNRMYVWEIMHSTISKMCKHIHKLRTDLDEAQGKKQITSKSDSEASDREEPEARDVYSEEQVEQMEERLESAHNEQKNLFLLVLQKFTIILTEQLLLSESEGKDFNTYWYRWITGRMRGVFLLHHEEIAKYVPTLESLLFTSDIDPHILEIFHQFCALRQ